MGLIGRNYKHSNVCRRPVLIHRTNTTTTNTTQTKHVCVPRPLIQYLTHHNTPNTSTHVSTLILCRWSTAAGKRPDPFRTRKLSPPTPMVLHPEECGRVGNRRPTTTQTKKEGGVPTHQWTLPHFFIPAPTPRHPPTTGRHAAVFCHARGA